MPKRSYDEVDEASEELIESLHDSDVLENALNSFENERASIGIAFSDVETKLLRDFKTTDPEKLSERDKIRFNTKLEYEESLRDDRLRDLDKRIDTFRKTHTENVLARKKRRIVKRKENALVRELNDKIDECHHLSKKECKDTDWKMLGKNKHIQQCLNKQMDSMSSEQKERYINVLKELKDKGWRILKKE